MEKCANLSRFALRLEAMGDRGEMQLGNSGIGRNNPLSPTMRLLSHAQNIYSQTGEDGILAKILEVLPTRDQWCVEFGAWDGQFLSNSCNLIVNHGYSAILIEADPIRFQDLTRFYAGNSKVVPLNRLVGFAPDDNLDTILAATAAPIDFDLLSIDIDGNDYHVWEATSRYRPKVVCIEYNPTIPTELEWVQKPDPAVMHGASLQSLVLLGRRKGYELVAVTQLNAIFVRDEFFPSFEIADNSPRVLREDVSNVAHIFCGYDGTIFLAGNPLMTWHSVNYRSRIRQLPRIFRGFPDNFGPIRKRLLNAFCVLSNLIARDVRPRESLPPKMDARK